jgi:hypothetical protein
MPLDPRRPGPSQGVVVAARSRRLGRLPTRFQWTLHNLVGHPLSEVCFQLGFEGLSAWFHDRTMPHGVGDE